jgi:hypothetical protein
MYHCITNRDIPLLARIGLLLLFLFLVWFASLLYYFSAYRPKAISLAAASPGTARLL